LLVEFRKAEAGPSIPSPRGYASETARVKFRKIHPPPPLFPREHQVNTQARALSFASLKNRKKLTQRGTKSGHTLKKKNEDILYFFGRSEKRE
jgi:hypothetical protein